MPFSDARAVVAATLVVVSTVAVLSAIGGGTAGAVHPSGAQDVTEESNFTVNFPAKTDHYPGDQNQENGSIEYFAVGEDAFHDMGASDGIYYDWIIVHAEYDGEDWIDYSACDTQNTKAFGIDRGNNNSGTQIDDDLVTKRKDSEFRDDGIVIEFYDWEDTFEDPPFMRPEDAIVAAQGAGSPAGPCLTLTEEPGWYRIASFANATVNDNHPDEKPTENAEYVEFQLQSNYLYVCECDSRTDAEEELGPAPPDREGTPTPTESGDEPNTPTPTEPGDEPNTPTPTEPEEEPGSGTQTESEEDPGSGTPTDLSHDEDDDDDVTPEADGPGFGPLAALVALLATTLLARRRS